MKPYPDFPLTLHKASGQWVKKIRGKIRYFGKDADRALAKYLDQRDDLQAGRVPRQGGITVKQLCNAFLTVKLANRDTGEIKPRTFADYKRICDQVVDQFGKSTPVESLRPTDFMALNAKWAKTRGPVSRANDITRARVLFKFAFDEGYIPTPLRFGDGFKKPRAAVIRAARRERFFTAAEVRKLVATATGALKAMILLGINCGFGNTDCATLVSTALDLKDGWVNFPRPKTGVDRLARLWPETVEAISTVMHEGVVFRTARGHTWECTADRAISKEFAKLVRKCGVREGLGFYALRHTFYTVAETIDRPAASFIMGHTPATSDMSNTYREQMTWARLHAVAKGVRLWYLRKKKPRRSQPAGI